MSEGGRNGTSETTLMERGMASLREACNQGYGVHEETPCTEDEKPPDSLLLREATPPALPHPVHPSGCLRIPRGSFPLSAHTRTFKKAFFPHVSGSQWNNWRWQIQQRVRNTTMLERFFPLTEQEYRAVECASSRFPFAITPYYMSLLDPLSADHPIRRTVVPVIEELHVSPEEAEDPLGEERDSPVPGIVHRYPDRVLFLVTSFCSTYCRYCTRSRFVGHVRNGHGGRRRWAGAIEYISSHREVRDVLISGGDPLTLSDEALEWILRRVRAIPHVEIIRIGTKVPVVLPQRITKELTRMLRKFHPLWMSIHFTHPDELTDEVYEACARLADAGIPLGSQTVLLTGINDSVDVMKALVQRLLMARVRPYYLYQCDLIPGSRHFRTPVAKGFEIIEGLWGHTTGYAVPSYVIDAPGGGGKIPLLPSYLQEVRGDTVVLKNYEAKPFYYPDIHG